METGVEEVDDGFDGVDEYELGMCIDGDDNVEDVGELGVGRDGLILTEINESLMYPVADALQ